MLKIKNLTYIAQDNNQKIIDNVSCDFNKGKFFVITGENGSGKSTLAKLIAGLIAPTSGQISLCDTDITNLPIVERANLGISYAFQTPVRFKGVTVASLLQVAATGVDVLDQKISPENTRFLSLVGLSEEQYLHREVNNSLSGGELKRIEIASILARIYNQKSNFTIFDEPEAGIDLWSLDNLLEVFADLKKTHKDITIVVISHNQKILKMADQIVLMSKGKIKQIGTPNEILPTIKEQQLC